MRRSTSLFWAQLISGLVALGVAGGCKTKIRGATGRLTVQASLDGGTGTSFDIGQACAGFTTTVTLDLAAIGAPVDDISIAITPASSFFTVTQPAQASIDTGATESFTVTFNPPVGSNAAPDSATLVITSTNSDNPSFSIEITATVPNAPSNAVFAANCLNSNDPSAPEGTCNFLFFNPPNHGVPLNSSGSQVVDVTNNGCPPLDVAAMLQDGGDPEYSLSGLTSPIVFHQVVPVTVTFSPTSLTAASQVLTFTSNYPDAGLPYVVSLTGTGIAPVLTLNPISWNFPGAVPGQENCEQFTITNTGSESVTLNPPEIGDFPPGENGVFTIDAGWSQGTKLGPGDSTTCVVCVEFSDAGVIYTAELEVGFDQGGSSAMADAPLTAISSDSICTSEPNVFLPDDHMFCGVESGSFQISKCSDGGSCINISNISWSDGGNFENLATITSIDPTNTGPWQLCPDSAPITVSFSIHDNGAVLGLTDAIEIDSDATGQPKRLVDIVPVTYPVPRENGSPILIPTDAGPPGEPPYIAGYPILFRIEGNDDAGVNFVYQYYYTFLAPPAKLCINCGIPSWFDAGVSSLPYATDVWFTPQDKGTYTICPIMLEVDAGFGNCGFDAGYPGQGNPLCSAPIETIF